MSYRMELCPSGKPRYEGRAAAARARGKVNERRAKQGLGPLRLYKCRQCKDWHLTSQTAAEGRDRRARMPEWPPSAG